MLKYFENLENLSGKILYFISISKIIFKENYVIIILLIDWLIVIWDNWEFNFFSKTTYNKWFAIASEFLKWYCL